MDIYKKAAQVKLRVPTNKGEATVEQLWGFKTTELKNIIKELNTELKRQSVDDLDFLEEATTVDPIAQLRFDITKDVYLTKVAEAKEEATKKAAKESNADILAIISLKERDELMNKSAAELRAMLV